MDDVIRIGPSHPEGWAVARAAGVFDEQPPIRIAPARSSIPLPAPRAIVAEVEYHRYRAQATPRWLTYEDREQMRSLYRQVAGAQGLLSVDHIVPLRGRNVCGLHVPWNLQLAPLLSNQRKNNKHEE